MAKSDSTTFKSIVQAIPAIAGAYREGLQALESKDAGKVKPQNPRKLSGSALDLKAMMAGTSYYWIASGKVAILPNSPQARKIAKNKLVLCKELNLD